jgi:PAS domain S-box-containing protein
MGRPYCICAAGGAAEWFDPSHSGSLECFPVACQDLDREGVIRRINEPFSDLLGYAGSAVLGSPVWDLIAHEERIRAKQGYVQKLTRERHLLPFERSYVHADGRLVTVQVHDTLIQDTTGAVIGMRSALIDLSERCRREAEMSDGYAFADALIGAIPDGMIVADVLGTVTSMNAKAESLMGGRAGDCIGLPIETVLNLPRATSKGDPAGHDDVDRTLLSELLAGREGALRVAGPPSGPISEITLSLVVDSTKAVVGFLALLR